MILILKPFCKHKKQGFEIILFTKGAFGHIPSSQFYI